MTGSRLAVHTAVYAALTADDKAGGLLDPNGPLVAGVWDNVPEGTAPPYVQLGEFSETPENTTTSRGAHVQAMLRIYTEDTQGFAQAARVIDRLDALLDEVLGDVTGLATTLNGLGWSLVMARKVTNDSMRNADGLSLQVPAQYMIWVQQPRA